MLGLFKQKVFGVQTTDQFVRAGDAASRRIILTTYYYYYYYYIAACHRRPWYTYVLVVGLLYHDRQSLKLTNGQVSYSYTEI